jgi:ABC-type transport system involved in multi-copper enzyme maturation permease subunit
MLWLTYRQHRIELGVMLMGAIAIAVVYVAAALYVAGVRAQVGLDACPVVFGNSECVARFDEYRRLTGQVTGLPLALYIYPIIVAAFLAGPIFARDFENGTHRLVWTQGITRMRWATSKLVIVCAAAAVAGLAIASVGGLTHELMLGNTGPWSAFDFQAPVVVSYLIFAVALGAATGVLLRRTIGAMLASLLVFVGVRLLVESKLRPNFLPMLSAPGGGFSQTVTPVPQDAWQFGIRYVHTSTGLDFPQEQFNKLMQNFRGGDLYAYLQSNDVASFSYYQPADRYWLFQSIETAIFLGLSLVLILLTVWLVRRRA